MALIDGLQRVLFLALPFNTIEHLLPRFASDWLQHHYPDNYEMIWRYQTEPLLPNELTAKIAAWSGAPSFFNQMFLPYMLTNLTVIGAGNLALFADTLFRRQQNPYALLAILRQLRRDPRKAEDMLAYYFSYSYNVADQVLNVLSDDLVTGRIVLTARARRIILAANSVYVPRMLRDIVHGMENSFAEVEKPPHFETQYYAFGNFLATGNFDVVESLPTDRLHVALFFNTAVQITMSESVERTILQKLASEILRANLRGADLPFPTGIVIDVNYIEVLQARAHAMLILVPQLYAVSAERDEYLKVLNFIVQPGVGYVDGIPVTLCILFNRINLLNEDEIWNIAAPFTEVGLYLPDVAAFFRAFLPVLANLRTFMGGQTLPAELAAKLVRSKILPAIVTVAALTGKLAAVSAEIFRHAYPALLPRSSKNGDDATVEGLRKTLQEAQAILSQRRDEKLIVTIYWYNSLVLQYLHDDLQFEIFDQSADKIFDGGTIYFRHGAIRIIEPLTRYDYETWLVVENLPLQHLTTPNLQQQEITRLLAV